MLLLLLAALVADGPVTPGAWHPFPWAYSLLEGENREATDVIVVNGEKFDGRVSVIECWTGNFQPGTKLSIPMLGAYAANQQRTIFWASSFGLVHVDHRNDKELRKAEKESPGHVSGRRIIVLLERKSCLNQDTPLTEGARAILNAPENEDKSLQDFLPVSQEALIWADNGHLYGFQSTGFTHLVITNPRDLIDQQAIDMIFPIGITESQLKDRVVAANKTRQRLASLKTISNPLSRAREAVRAVHGQSEWARCEAIVAISGDITVAVRLVRSLLTDDSMLDVHGDILLVLAAVENHDAMADIKADLDRQFLYWARHAADTVDDTGQASNERWQRLTALYQTIGALIMQPRNSSSALPGLRRLSGVVERHPDLGQFKPSGGGRWNTSTCSFMSDWSLDELLKFAVSTTCSQRSGR
jgi:hypothetical protein